VRKYGITILLLALCLDLFAEGELTAPEYASGAAEYLKLPIHGDAASRNGAVTASGDWTSASRYNPSLIDKVDSLQVVATYTLMTLDRKLVSFDLAHPVGGYTVLGASFTMFTILGFDARDSIGIPAGSFNDRENAVSLSAAGRFIGGISGGLTLRYLIQQLESEKANGLGIDLGACYAPLPWLNTGISACNLLSWMWWSTGRRDQVLPLVRAGIAGILFDSSLAIEIDGEKTIKQPVEIAGSISYEFFGIISLKAGGRTGIDVRDISYRPPDFSCGLGFHYKSFGFVYGLRIPGSELGLAHTFTLTAVIPTLNE